MTPRAGRLLRSYTPVDVPRLVAASAFGVPEPATPVAAPQLVGLRRRFDVAFANDTDADRHGSVCLSSRLMNLDHPLTAATGYLLTNRPGWPGWCSVGKTVVPAAA